MIELIIGFLFGFIGHKSDHWIKGWEKTPETWRQLSRSGIGVVITIIPWVMIRRAMGLKTTFPDLASFILSFVNVGSGVAAGHAWDDLER